MKVAFKPLKDSVAALDVSGDQWVMYLDSDSPPEDHVWALLEALELATQAVEAADAEAAEPHLRVLPDLRNTTDR